MTSSAKIYRRTRPSDEAKIVLVLQELGIDPGDVKMGTGIADNTVGRLTRFAGRDVHIEIGFRADVSRIDHAIAVLGNLQGRAFVPELVTAAYEDGAYAALVTTDFSKAAGQRVDIAALTQTLGLLHREKTVDFLPPWSPRADWDADVCSAWRAHLGDKVKLVAKEAAKAKIAGSKWVHGDVTVKKVCTVDKQILLVGWEHSAVGSPDIDLGGAALLAALAGEDLAIFTPNQLRCAVLLLSEHQADGEHVAAAQTILTALGK